MEQVREEERRIVDDKAGSIDAGTMVAAFGLGLLAGAAVMLLTTPESGSSVRSRVKRGVDTVRHELDEIVEETKESWSQVRDDAREAIKRTAAKMKESAPVTKDALAEDLSSVRRVP